MARLIWGATGTRFFEAGVDCGVLYPKVGPGVPWNGLVSVTNKSSAGERTAHHIDGVKYAEEISSAPFGVTINALNYPAEFNPCLGIAHIAKGLHVDGQPKESFGFAYRTKIGNDVEGLDHAYKTHLIYNAVAAASAKSYSSDSAPSPVAFSWPVATTPIAVPGWRPFAHISIASNRVDERLLRIFEDVLYGSDETEPRLPDPTEVLDIFSTISSWSVVDNGDGTARVTGSNLILRNVSPIGFDISTAMITPVSDGVFSIESL